VGNEAKDEPLKKTSRLLVGSKKLARWWWWWRW